MKKSASKMLLEADLCLAGKALRRLRPLVKRPLMQSLGPSR